MEGVAQAGSKYTDEQRRQAAIQYAIQGNMKAVEREIGIPRTTLQDWKDCEWFQAIMIGARAEIEDQFRANCHAIVEAADKATIDRLENGDYVHTKDGIVRMPVKAKDAATISAIKYDKLRLSLNLPTSISSSSGNKQVIANLADQFRALSESYKARNINVIAEQQPGDEQSDAK